MFSKMEARRQMNRIDFVGLPGQGYGGRVAGPRLSYNRARVKYSDPLGDFVAGEHN